MKDEKNITRNFEYTIKIGKLKYFEPPYKKPEMNKTIRTCTIDR